MQRVAGASKDMTPLPPHPPREPVQRLWGYAQMTRYIHYKKRLIHMFGAFLTFNSHVWRVLSGTNLFVVKISHTSLHKKNEFKFK